MGKKERFIGILHGLVACVVTFIIVMSIAAIMSGCSIDGLKQFARAEQTRVQAGSTEYAESLAISGYRGYFGDSQVDAFVGSTYSDVTGEVGAVVGVGAATSGDGWSLSARVAEVTRENGDAEIVSMMAMEIEW